MPPRRGGICGRLTYDSPSTRFQGWQSLHSKPHTPDPKPLTPEHSAKANYSAMVVELDFVFLSSCRVLAGSGVCTLNPESWTLNPKPQTLNPEPQTLNLSFEPLNPKPQTSSTQTETRNSEPGIQNPKPETRNPKPETRNPKPEARNPKPETRNPKHEVRNPKPETQRLGQPWAGFVTGASPRRSLQTF